MTTASSQPNSSKSTNFIKPRRGLAAWTTLDLLVLTVISLVCGLVNLVVTQAWMAFSVVAGPILGDGISGYSVIFYMLAPFIVRQPGAAVLSSFIASLAQVPFNPYGFLGLFVGLLFGVLAEIVFLILRYRNYSTLAMMLGGVFIMGVGIAIKWLPVNYNALPVINQIGIVVATLIGGAVGGWVMTLLAKALARTGVLSGTAISAHTEV